MPKREGTLYPRAVQELIAKKSAVISKAQTFSELGMEDMARQLWATAGGHEERLAPLLDSLGHELEAAIHRISAAGCYRRAGDLTAAANLYRGALAGPLLAHTRPEVERHFRECLAELSRTSFRSVSTRRRQKPAANA
ncbi:MAG: hypothetical protein L0Y71_04950 [Gemmataceae bacterium]|nr:hypothetical protein [Gemmataceae bacterium]